jgi:hypothetical protein
LVADLAPRKLVFGTLCGPARQGTLACSWARRGGMAWTDHKMHKLIPWALHAHTLDEHALIAYWRVQAVLGNWSLRESAYRCVAREADFDQAA